MSGVGSENAGRAWVLAKIAEDSSMKDAVKAIAKLNRGKKPKETGPAKEWYIVRADELADVADLMIVVDADLPDTLNRVVKLLSDLEELEIAQVFRVKVEWKKADKKWVTFHHPSGPHQGQWDEVEKPADSGSQGSPSASGPEKPEGPHPNPLNPWG